MHPSGIVSIAGISAYGDGWKFLWLDVVDIGNDNPYIPLLFRINYRRV
jgi:hypothetical protein